MKKIFILIITVMSCISMHAELTSSQKTDALAFAKSICGDGEYEYFYSSTFFSHTYPQNITRESVLIFADLEPATSWEHNCKYIYLSTSLDRYEVVDSMLPPADLTLRPLELLNRSASAMQLFRLPIYHANDGDASGRTYAVIINGGLNRSSNHERYWNDCAFIYQTLRNTYDVPKSHIKVVYADGADPTPDLQLAHSGELVNSPLDLDGDNVDDIQYSATKANLQTVFQDLGNTITDEDHLFVFVTGHGSKPFTGNSSPSMYLWNNVKLYPDEFAEYLDMVDAQCISVVMGQCYSGAFINALHGNNRIITTACTDSEKSYEHPDFPFNSFLYNWTCAMNMANHLGNVIDSDKDHNGYISFNEAFTYADKQNLFLSENNRFRHQTPQLDYIAGVLYDDLSFDRMPEAVDLYIRDDIRDMGKEPNSEIAGYFWNSPDLYLRLEDDGFENEQNQYYRPEPDDTYKTFYIYAKIHNRGSKDYNWREQRKYIHLFFANADGRFSKNKFLGLDNNEEELGAHISWRMIDQDIPVGSSAIIKLEAFYSCDFYSYKDTAGFLPLALLGVISDSQMLPNFLTLDTADIDEYINIRTESNDVAMKNECPYVIPKDTAMQRCQMVPENNCRIEFHASKTAILDNISLRIPNQLRNTNNSSPGDNNYNNNVTLPLDATYGFDMSINPNNPYIDIKFESVDDICEGDSLTIIQKNSNGDIIGGKTYIFICDDTADDNSGSSEDSSTTCRITRILNMGNSLRVELSEPISNATISVFDSKQNIPISSSNVAENSTSAIINLPQIVNGMLVITLSQGDTIIDQKRLMKIY